MANNYGRGQSTSDKEVNAETARSGGAEVTAGGTEHSVAAHHYGRGQVQADACVAYPVHEMGKNTGKTA